MPASSHHLRAAPVQAGEARPTVLTNHDALEGALDPRWVLAAQVRAQMEGAMLPPEKRERLLRLGSQLGLRAFDANVIIALVQDSARRHEPLSATEPMLRLVPHPDNRSPRRPSSALRWIAAAICAAGATLFMIWWLLA